MDPCQMIEAHIQSGVGVTVAGIRVPRTEAHRFGVLKVGSANRITAFWEKPAEADGLENDPDHVFASMGNYVFTTKTLVDAVKADAENLTSRHDMGGDIITMLVRSGDAAVYDFDENKVPGSTERDRGYWRDVGTLDSYYEAQMDLISVHPVFNLYNFKWPIHSFSLAQPPAKFVFDEDGRRGAAMDSLVSAGVIVSGGQVRRSIVSPGVRIHDRAFVDDSVLMHDVSIGQDAIVRRAIIDKNVRVPPRARLGVDLDHDRARGFTVSEAGVVVIGKGDVITESP
jgi:glucose-1-phosphate adenylyltransferase